MINQKRIQLTKLALALSIALSTAPSFAQNTTSAIGGRISASDGRPAAGANVSIVHVESGSVSTVVTDAEGRYVARGLRTGGPYTIVITQNGQTEKREGVYLNLAETASVDATIGAPIQSVTVTGSATRSDKFSRTNMGSGTTISATELASQASIQRNLQDYARADPRVSQTDKERGEISVAGQNSRYNSMTIDGVSVSDTFGLESNGSPTARQPISIEAIQSVQVNVANYDVTQKGYTGANINAVTKSGTNTWKGAGYYVFRNDTMAGQRYNKQTQLYFDAPDFTEKTKGVWVSGPIIKDKLFFFALTEEHTSSRTTPDFGPIGTNAGTTVGISQAAIAGAIDVAKSTYNMDIGTFGVPAGAQLKVREDMLKLDWNINDNHRAMFRYSKTAQSEPQFPGLSQSGVALSSHFYDQNKVIKTMVGQVFSDWTPNFTTEFKVSTRDYDSVPRNNSRLPVVGLQFNGPLAAGAPAGTGTGSRFINFGTERSRQNNVLGNKTLDLYFGGNLSMGDHEIKGGVDVVKNEIYNAFLQDVNGNYTFSCVNESATYQYTFNGAATNFNCGTGATAAQIEQAVLENFRIGRPSSFSVQIPVVGGSLSDAISQFTLKNTGVFLQDTWNVSPRLTLTYGARLDQSSVDRTPKRNDAAAQARVAGNATTGVRETGGFGLDNTVTIDGQKLFQPRFGFNYKLSEEKNMQLRGGVGLFQGAAATVWLSNPFSNPGVATRVVSCSTTSTPACPVGGGLFSSNPDAQKPELVAGATPAANVDFLDPSLRQPSIYKSNIAFDTELPWMGLVFGAEYLYLKNKDSIYYEHLNLGAPTRIGPDGRQMFWNGNVALGGYSANCFSASGALSTNGCSVRSRALSNANFNNVLLAKKTDKGDGNVVTMSLSRPMTKGLGWSIAFTRTDATEVSPLTSSVALSNFNARSIFNPNEEIAAESSYLVRDRVNALFTFQKKFFGNNNTRFGIFYEGRSGKPYSWTINNDLNGDAVAGNDLMYVPTAFGSGEVVFFGDTATNKAGEQRFWDIVNANDVLKRSAGKTVGRNSDRAPWANSIDLRISQELATFGKQKATFSLDFLNFGNLINKRWGRIDEVAFQSAGGVARSFVDYAGLSADGKYVYSVRPLEETITRQAKGESQWAIQATFKYEF
ncbi:MAG: TonB-dependent receptor [Pseudomonadota bacterium]